MDDIYKVIKGGRNCLSQEEGRFLKEGDYLHKYGSGVVKVATPTTPYQITSMFFSELIEPLRWKNEGSYELVTDIGELNKIQPHLTNGKKFMYIDNFKEFVKNEIVPF